MGFEQALHRELAPYLSDPPAMAAGGAGKRGVLHLQFKRDGPGYTRLTHLYRQTPLIVQQALYFDRHLPQMSCVYILSAAGPQVDGDRYEICVEAGPEAEVHLSTGAATKLASMRHNFVSSELHISLGPRAYVEYLPLPLIPCRHSRLWSTTEFVIDPTATLIYTDCTLAGRCCHQNELFAYDLLAFNLRAVRPTGEELFGERVVLQPPLHHPLQGELNTERIHFATALIFTPAEHHAAIEERLKGWVCMESECAFALLRLPLEAGFLCRMTASRSDWLIKKLRLAASEVRAVVKGVSIPEEFPWR